jgi:hypothetical protein
MEKRNISKIGLSLLIALAFLIPTGAMADGNGPDNEAGVIQREYQGSGGIGALYNDGPYPVEIINVEVGDATYEPYVDITAAGLYDINITKFRPFFGGDVIEFDGDLDANYSHVHYDDVTEVGTTMFIDIFMAGDCDFIYIYVISNRNIGSFDFLIDEWDGGSVLIDDTTVGVDHIGLGTPAVEIRIPRGMVDTGPCFEYGFVLWYVFWNPPMTRANEGCVDNPLVEAAIIADCECALEKAFVDIYKMDPLPCELIYETDFEDPADIYNNWEAYDLPSWDASSPGGAIDTWRWNDYNSHSPTRSMHNSFIEDSYYGNQQDSLNHVIDNSKHYETIEIEFWHYMDGEEVDRYSGSAYDALADYGVLEYWDGADWEIVPTWYVYDWCDPDEYGYYTEQMWWNTLDEDEESPTYDEIIWQHMKGELTGMETFDEIEIRFRWVSNACNQYEGWFIDDFMTCGVVVPEPDEFVAQMYSPIAFEMCDETMKYTFPRPYEFTEGTYLLKFWLLEEDDCHYAAEGSSQEARFEFEFEVRDFCELSITNEILDADNLFNVGDDLIVEATVTNDGTICCYDIPVTFEVKEKVVTTLFEDFVEGGWYDLSGQKGYDPYSDEAFESGVIEGIDFEASDRVGVWHVVEDFQFVSPNHAWYCAEDRHYPAGLSDHIKIDFDKVGISPGDYRDAVLFDFVGKLNYDIHTDDVLYMFSEIGNTWISWGWTGQLGTKVLYGDTTTGGWIDFSEDEILQEAYGYDFWARHEPFLAGYGDGTWDSLNGIGFMLDNWPRTGTVGDPLGAWSGVLIDDWKIYAIEEGATVYSQTIIIDELCPGETVVLSGCDGFVWQDMPTGLYIECKSVPLDDPIECKYINDDNEACDEFKVTDDVTCMEDCDVEHYDISEDDEENFWHICDAGYDSYLVWQDPETGLNPHSTDNVILLKSDDNSAHPDCEASMDWSADPMGVTISFDTLEDIEGWGGDEGYIEINPGICIHDEPCMSERNWYRFDGPWFWGSFGAFWWWFGFSEVPWDHYDLFLDPADFWSLNTGNNYLVDLPGGFTDDMALRFRATSDGNFASTGWYIDDINISGTNSGTIYETNPCDDMDRFILGYLLGGDWWHWDDGYGGWVCQDVTDGTIPNEIDDVLIWTADTDQAYYAELEFTYTCDLETGYDFAYLGFSDDGTNFVEPVAFSGVEGPDATFTMDITSFLNNPLFIRFRVETDEATKSTVFSVKDICITGFTDKVAPVTLGTLSGTMIHGWYSSAVTFTATATDDVSGVAATYYRIDGGSTMTYTGPVSISVNGPHQIEYWSIDNVGNEEVHKFTPEFMIDTGDAPSVSITAPTNGLYLFGNNILSMSQIIIIGGFTAEATASDDDSGVYKVEFQLDGTTFGEATSAPYSAYCGLKHTGDATLTAIAEDFTGQTAQDTLSLKYFKFL